MSREKYIHRYSIRNCPDCGNDLTRLEGVFIEVFPDGWTPRLIPSHLSDVDGAVEDVDEVIEAGWHGDTLCGCCERSLNDYEDVYL